MEIEILNPYAMKIIIAARKHDSINSIAKRINLSYGWTHKWVKQLIKAEVFIGYRLRLELNEENQFYKDSLDYIKKNFSKDINFYYSVLDLFGIKYCFTKTDSVFIWTDGGYNISRYSDYYPIFIKIRKIDKKNIGFYIKKLKIKGKIFYKPLFLEDFPVSLHRNAPVDSLEDTIKFMRKYIYNFEPALEMIKEMYGKKLKVKYKEVVTNV